MTARTNLFSRTRGRHARAQASASSARAKRLTAALALTILLLPTLFFLQVPTARADQVPAGSGAYYHVGDNILSTTTASSAYIGTAQLTSTNCLGCAFDGNTSSYYQTTGAATGTNCAAPIIFNFTLATPVRADLIHANFNPIALPGSASGCTSIKAWTTSGPAIVLDTTGYAQFQNYDKWYNFTTTQNLTAISFQFGSIGNNNGAWEIRFSELEALDKNATTSDPIRAIANQAAANVQCYATGASYLNFASNSYTAPLGTFYLFVPAVMPASSTSTPNPMQVFASLGGVNATFYGWSRVVPDITGSRSDAVAIWRVTTAQAGLPIFVKPTGSGNVNATDTVCRFERVGAMYSTTLANGYVTAPLATWGGGANDLWGVVHMANAYPVNAVYDTDLSGQSPTLFSPHNMTFGPQLYPSGVVGQNATVSLATLPPHVRQGNAFIIALGQNASAQSSSTNYQILINGNPASVLANTGVNAQGFQYALFYVDDIAERNGLNNTANNVGQSGYRPLSAETYAITLAGGFDANFPVYAGNTYGLTGHAGLTCFTLCGANLYNFASTLPAANGNLVVFNVTNATTGQPVTGARVLNTNNTTAVLTNSAGFANFSNVFTPTHFTITAPGYAATCASFYYKSQSAPTSGASDSLGCGYVIGASATFNVILGTTTSVAGNAGGTLTIGGSTIQITFNVTNPTFPVGGLVEVTVNRTQGADLWVVLYQLDPVGNPQRAGGFTPYAWASTQPHALPVTWPDGRTLNAADTGNYVLTVSTQTTATSNGTLLAYNPIGVAQTAPIVGTSLLTNLNVAAQNDINRQASVNNALQAVITEATVQQHFLEWLDWFPRTDLFVPNAVLYPALFMVGALMLRFGRNTWGR